MGTDHSSSMCTINHVANKAVIEAHFVSVLAVVNWPSVPTGHKTLNMLCLLNVGVGIILYVYLVHISANNTAIVV